MKIATIIGARPQFIKAAAVSNAMRRSSGVEEVLIHTGQHYDKNMSDIFFEELEIPKPGIQLGLGSGPHGEQTGRMLEAIESVLLDQRPDWTLVYGDTNSTLAGALASVKLGIPTAHVEAGLRSFNHFQPEEINRLATDAVAQMLFAPTETAKQLLLNSGHRAQSVCLSGDVMYDASLIFRKIAAEKSDCLERHALSPGDFILATAHRAENTDNPARIAIIVEAFEQLSRDHRIILPLHPRTMHALKAADLLNRLQDAVQCVEPVGFLDMIQLERHAKAIVTDSGGIQKEAFFLKVPCITLRDETEWTELIDLGCNRLASPTSTSDIVDAVKVALEASGNYERSPYGDGKASEIIVEKLKSM